MADITTTTEEEGERMSDMIQFVAQLTVDVGRRDSQIQRALQVLQRAQRYDVDPMGDYYQGEGMVHSSSGDYVEFSDVGAAIDILQEGQP